MSSVQEIQGITEDVVNVSVYVTILDNQCKGVLQKS